MNGYRFFYLAVLGGLLSCLSANLAWSDVAESETPQRVATEASVSAGYRGVGTDDNPNRALEYDSLESSPTLNAKFFTDRGNYHLDLGVNYLNEDDYNAEVHLDTKGLLRLDLTNERFYHNLDHIPYDNGYTGTPAERSNPALNPVGLPADGSRPDAFLQSSPRAYYTDQNPGDEYGVRLDMSEVKLKLKCPDYPAHINFSYWRYEKKGDKQLRFVSEGGIEGDGDVANSANCVGCHMQSKTRNIDRVTDEFKVSADAHAGFVDIVLETLYRSFHDNEDIPVDEFGVHNRGREAGYYQHDEDPDSRVTEATLKLNTAPSGGLVGSASFTIGERKNLSDLNAVTPVDAKTDYYKTAADITYTPSQNWTFNLRYRLLDLDSDNTNVITETNGAVRDLPLDVRQSMDITRAWYEALATYRLTPRVTLKAEFRREDIDRSNTGPESHPFHSPGALDEPIPVSENWQLPDEETITRVKLGFNGRFLEKSALKLNGWLALQKNEDPAYGTSFADSQELFLTASYNPSPTWGMIASLNILNQENSDFGVEGMQIILPDTYLLAGETELDSKNKQQNFSLGSWFIPTEGLSFDLNYGYMRTAIDQDLLFGRVILNGTDFRIEDGNVEYRQSVQNVTLGANWQPIDKLSCRLEGYHIRSKANYDPGFPTEPFAYYFGLLPGTASSADLRDISEVDIRQNGVRGRVNWQFDENWSCAVEATFDDYDELNSDVYDGSVQTCMVSFSRSW